VLESHFFKKSRKANDLKEYLQFHIAGLFDHYYPYKKVGSHLRKVWKGYVDEIFLNIQPVHYVPIAMDDTKDSLFSNPHQASIYFYKEAIDIAKDIPVTKKEYTDIRDFTEEERKRTLKAERQSYRLKKSRCLKKIPALLNMSFTPTLRSRRELEIQFDSGKVETKITRRVQEDEKQEIIDNFSKKAKIYYIKVMRSYVKTWANERDELFLTENPAGVFRCGNKYVCIVSHKYSYEVEEPRIYVLDEKTTDKIPSTPYASSGEEIIPEYKTIESAVFSKKKQQHKDKFIEKAKQILKELEEIQQEHRENMELKMIKLMPKAIKSKPVNAKRMKSMLKRACLMPTCNVYAEEPIENLYMLFETPLSKKGDLVWKKINKQPDYSLHDIKYERIGNKFIKYDYDGIYEYMGVVNCAGNKENKRILNSQKEILTKYKLTKKAINKVEHVKCDKIHKVSKLDLLAGDLAKRFKFNCDFLGVAKAVVKKGFVNNGDIKGHISKQGRKAIKEYMSRLI